MAPEVEPAVADQVIEIESMAAKWTTNPWKKLSKSSNPAQRADLELLYSTTHLAYEKEHTHIPSAYQLHVVLERAWAKFARAASDTGDLQLSSRQIKARAALHNERAKTLERFLTQDANALTVSMPIHPSMELAIRGMSDVLLAKNGVGGSEPHREGISCLLHREFEFPGQTLSSDARYTDGLPQDLPTQQYKIWMDGGIYVTPTYTVYMIDDAIKFKQHTVMTLCTVHQPGKWPQPMTHAYTWRPAEWPVPSMRLKSWGVSQTMGTVGLYTQIFGLQTPMSIIEDPDVLNQFKWDTSRRFTFGGRKFVWKPKKIPGKRKWTPYKNFEVFEYTDVAPGNPDDPNDVVDDASFTSIFWTEDHGERIICVGGLDPVLKEYLIANTVLRLAIRRYGIVSVAPEAEDEGTAAAKMVGKMVAEGGVNLLQILLGA